MNKVTSEEIKEFVSRPLFDEKVILNKDPSWPIISIITPSYNQAEFLERTILSVLNQNYPNLEFIIIDGGSTDGSVEIIKKYEKYLGYWVSEKDNGQTHAINKGFKMATGQLIGWQNSDDFYLPSTFDSLIRYMANNSRFDVYYANRLNVDHSDKILMKAFYIRPSQYVYRYRGMTICNQSSFLRRSLLSSIGFLDESLNYAMDHEYYLRMLLKNVKMRHINQFWSAARYHSKSKGCNNNIEAWNKEHERIYKRYNMKWRGCKHTFFQISMALVIKAYYLVLDNGIELFLEKGRVNKHFS